VLDKPVMGGPLNKIGGFVVFRLS